MEKKHPLKENYDAIRADRHLIREVGRGEVPILPLGTITISTGKSKYFNIYEHWSEETIYEIWKVQFGQSKTGYAIVAATGGGIIPAKKGVWTQFVHDQSGRYLFNGEMVDYAVGRTLKAFTKYGKSIKGYTYK